MSYRVVRYLIIYIRYSEPSYNKEEFIKAGIEVEECFFVDGASPPDDVIRRWNDLVSRTFDNVKTKDKDTPCIAVHCVAGLGRAPVLVAIALIEHGKEAVEAVSFIRERRRGAINAVQLAYLESYKPTRRSGKSCTLM